MKRIDCSRPDVLFALIWIITTALAYADLYYMKFDSSIPVTLLILSNVISFFIAYKIANRFSNKKRISEVYSEKVDLNNLTTASYVLAAVWFILFVYIVYRSQGLPILWKLNHVDKSYTDFGVPTLSGFANMLRTLIVCLSILIYLNNKDRVILILPIVLFLFSIFELARANTIYLLLCGLAVFVVHKKTSLKQVRFLVVSSLAFVLLFGVAEQVRSTNGSGGEKIMQYESILNKLPYGVTSVYLYLTTPVSNLYFAEAHGIQPLYYPYFLLQVAVPTIVREKLFKPHEFPISLRRDSFNATTFYSPFIADFGIPIAGFLVFIVQLIVSHVHVRAKRGDFYYQLIYAPLFTSVALSFFDNYFISLIVILFPLAVFLVRRNVAGRAKT